MTTSEPEMMMTPRTSLTTETAPVLDQHRFDEAALEHYMEQHVEGFTPALTVGQVQGAIDALQVDLGNGVQYDGAAQTSVTLAGAGGTTIANLADGDVSATSTEAVNGSQLFATNQEVAANADDIAALDDSAVQYDDASGTLVTLDGAGGTTIANVADGTLSDTSSDAVNGSQLFATNQNVAANTDGLDALQDSAVQYDDASNALVTLDGADGTTITNVAEGTLSGTSTDAVNGSQLFATNQQVAVNTAGIGDLDDRVTINADAIFDLDDTVTTLDTRVTQNRTDIDALQASVGNVPIGYVNNTDPTVFSSVPTNRVALIGATPGTAVTLSNVAAGELSAGSNDAVNGSQLFATNQQVDVNTAAIQANTDAIAALGDGGSGNALAVLYDDDSRTSLTLDGAVVRYRRRGNPDGSDCRGPNPRAAYQKSPLRRSRDISPRGVSSRRRNSDSRRPVGPGSRSPF